MIPKFSIIIPFYNSSTTIKRNINSIPLRDDIEIFIIDDNSESQESEILYQLYSERPEVTILKSEQNLGAGHARNMAIEKATGRWLIFADADDYFTHSFNECLNRYGDSNADVVYFSATSIKEITGEISTRHRAIENQINSALANVKGAIDDLRFNFYGPVCKFIKLNLVKEYNLRFQETFAFNDALFSVSVGYYAKKIELCKESIYCITECQCSTSYTLSERIISSRIYAINAVNRFYKKHSICKYRMRLLPQLIYARKLGLKGFLRILRLSVILKIKTLLILFSMPL